MENKQIKHQKERTHETIEAMTFEIKHQIKSERKNT